MTTSENSKPPRDPQQRLVRTLWSGLGRVLALAALVLIGLLVAGLVLLARRPVASGQDVAFLERPPPVDAKDQPPIQYWRQRLEQPRQVEIHCLKIDLRNRSYEVVAIASPDPDGDGAAEATLQMPLELAAAGKALAAVNANLFKPLAGSDGSRIYGQWKIGQAVEIESWVVADGRLRGALDYGYFNFWIDPEGGGHIDRLRQGAPALQAVSGGEALVLDGQAREPGPGASATPQPATALGLDRDGRWLWLVVVDGRRPDYSEGMTVPELGELMAGLGCWRAMTMDGGASSVMLASRSWRLQIVNRPCGPSGPRPVPVMLGVRRRTRY